jgi:uncharacterized protein
MTKQQPVQRATTVDLTESCNLACDYCFTWGTHKTRKRMSWKMLTNIIEWWFPQTDPKDTRQFSFWGGEPLLEWGTIKKAVKYIKDRPQFNPQTVEFGGTTNGVLYTPDKVEWCVENNSLFLVSLDGVEDVHDMHRKTHGGKGSWKIVDKNVREAIKIAPNQRIRCSITADTIHRFFENAQYFIDDLGVDHFAFSPVFEGDWSEERLEILDEQFTLITDYVIKKHKEGNYVQLKHLVDEAKIAAAGSISPQNVCGAANHYSCWSYDGYAYPCHRFNKHNQTTEDRAKSDITIVRPVGDSFEWIHDEWRNDFITFKDNPPKSCQGCEIFGNAACKGACYATNYDMTGSIFKQPKSVCDYFHLQRKAGIYYKEQLDKLGLQIDGIRIVKKGAGHSCICYNMCYCEGTPKEITHINRSTDTQCICYNTNYSGEREPQRRTLEEIDKQKRAEKRMVDAAIQVMNDFESGKLVETKDSCGPDCKCKEKEEGNTK